MCKAEEKREFEKDIQLDSNTGLDDLAMTSEGFNGGYIEANTESYDLLTAFGYKDNMDMKESLKQYFRIESGQIRGTNVIMEAKQFYINKGKLSWEKPDEVKIVKNTEFTSTSAISMDTYEDHPLNMSKCESIDPHAELKEKYATGEYDCYCENWNTKKYDFIKKCVFDSFEDNDVNYQPYALIKKEHSHIAQAVIENPDVDVFWIDEEKRVWIAPVFFKRYNENTNYTLKPFKVTETTEDPELLEARLNREAFFNRATTHEQAVEEMMKEAKAKDVTPKYYGAKCKCGAKLDPYVICDAYDNIRDSAHHHAVKKLIRAGEGHKDLNQDIQEVIETLQRWQEQKGKM